MNRARDSGSAWEVFRAALGLGLTSFGGPIAHVGYFERTYVRERRWLTGEDFTGLLALCQVLPGPASSQLHFLIGMRRAGWFGALAAWLGFTLPSALFLLGCALLAARINGPAVDAVLHGLKLMAVTVVAQAVWSMGKRLCADRVTAAIAILAAALMLIWGGSVMQFAALALGAVAGLLFRVPLRASATVPIATMPSRVPLLALLSFLVLLIGLPIAARLQPHGLFDLADVFYRSGALVFGGGHVVLPLLRDALVPAGWMTDDQFLTGYGLAQAVPGPLFAVAAYFGAANAYVSSPLAGATVALLAIFLPGLLLATAGMSFWGGLRSHARVTEALAGVNAAVVGILAAAFYNPVFTTAVNSLGDAAVAGAGFLVFVRWNLPPLAVLVGCLAYSLIRFAFTG